MEARFPTDRLSRRALARLLRRPSAEIWVAELEGALVGDAVLLFRARSRVARLYSLVVTPACQGRGFGGEILRCCEAAAAARGADTLVLEVRTDNVAALRLYERAGYQPLGLRSGYYQDGSDARCLGRALAQRR